MGASPAKQLDSFLRKYSPAMQKSGRAAIAKMRKLVPGATELVYDNYQWLVIGFGPTERASEAVFSIVLPPNHVTLCFLQGAGLPDPGKRLKGSGRVVRNVRLETDKTLDEPEVRALIAAAKAFAKVPFDVKQKRKLIIKSVSAKQRPRRVEPVHRATSR